MPTTIQCKLIDEEAAAVAAAVTMVLRFGRRETSQPDDYLRTLADAMASLQEQFSHQRFDAAAFCAQRGQR